MIREYPKTYEDIFSTDSEFAKCDIGEMEIDDMETMEYIKLFKYTTLSYQEKMYDLLLKSHWLRKRFKYSGVTRKKRIGNGLRFESAWGAFNRLYLSFPVSIYLHGMNHSVLGYTYDFFPEFDDNSPFKYKYEFPYKYMNFCCLFVVKDMIERLDLLEIGEREEMPYAEFIDYVINYIGCYNEDAKSLGNKTNAYTFKTSNKGDIPYVEVNHRRRKFKESRFY